jgi:hypothetical protein
MTVVGIKLFFCTVDCIIYIIVHSYYITRILCYNRNFFFLYFGGYHCVNVRLSICSVGYGQPELPTASKEHRKSKSQGRRIQHRFSLRPCYTHIRHVSGLCGPHKFLHTTAIVPKQESANGKPFVWQRAESLSR